MSSVRESHQETCGMCSWTSTSPFRDRKASAGKTCAWLVLALCTQQNRDKMGSMWCSGFSFLAQKPCIQLRMVPLFLSSPKTMISLGMGSPSLGPYTKPQASKPRVLRTMSLKNPDFRLHETSGFSDHELYMAKSTLRTIHVVSVAFLPPKKNDGRH